MIRVARVTANPYILRSESNWRRSSDPSFFRIPNPDQPLVYCRPLISGSWILIDYILLPHLDKLFVVHCPLLVYRLQFVLGYDDDVRTLFLCGSSHKYRDCKIKFYAWSEKVLLHSVAPSYEANWSYSCSRWGTCGGDLSKVPFSLNALPMSSLHLFRISSSLSPRVR